jgi:hypothetical protein
MLQTHAEEPDVGMTATASPHFRHDFSQIPIHAPAAGAIQAKLENNELGDEYEQEADHVADQVMAMPAHHAVSGAPPHIQRLAGQLTGQTEAAPASVDQALATPGRPLEPALRQDMEQRFGHNFSRVRVHSGAAAEQSAQDVKAHAYTVGHNMVFGTGRFLPGTHEGRRLLAHELTHVMQADVAVSNPAQPSSSVETLEREARQVAAAVRSGCAVPPVRGVARGLAAPLRSPDEDDVPVRPQADPGKPTYGNLPQDQPAQNIGARRMQLVKEGDKWYEIAPNRTPERRTAKGGYAFVVQNGRIFAIKSSTKDLGHTEAALGQRVSWAGNITFSNSGNLKTWDNGSGHYLPAGSTEVEAIEKNVRKVHPDLPIDKFVQPHRGSVIRPDTGKRQGPQLPVFQSMTKTGPTEPLPKGSVFEADPKTSTPKVETEPKPAKVTPSPGAKDESSVRPPGGIRISISPLLIQSALAGVKVWALLKLQRENDEKIKNDTTRIEKQVANLINLQINQIADYWIDFQPVFANVMTSVLVEGLTHLTANMDPRSGMLSGPPEHMMRYISSNLLAVNISDRSETHSASTVIARDTKQGTMVALTLEMNTTPLPLSVDNSIVRARISERIDAIDRELAHSPSSGDLQQAKRQLELRLALFQF